MFLAWCDIQTKTHQNTENIENKTGINTKINLPSIPKNDFSWLDRTIVDWSLNYADCKKRWGEITTWTGRKADYNFCKLWKETFEYKKGRTWWNEPMFYNDNVNTIFDTYKYLPIHEQNSLIEFFAPKNTIKKQIKITDLEQQCFEKSCFKKNLPIYQYKNRVAQEEFFNNEEQEGYSSEPEKIILLLNTKEKIFFKITYSMMGEELIVIHQTTPYTLTQKYIHGCTFRKIEQNINNTPNNFPQSFKIFGKIYNIQNLNTTWFNLGYYSETKRITQPLSIKNKKQIEQFLNKETKNTGKLYYDYIIEFIEYPWLLVYYKHTEENQLPPESVFFYTWEINTNNQQELIDFSTTKELFCTIRWSEWDFRFEENTCAPKKDKWSIMMKRKHEMMFFDDKKEKHFEKTETEESYDAKIIFNKRILPLFKITKTPEKNWYFLRWAEWVKFDNSWAGCKPVIYLYDKHKRENQVSITLPKYGSFTKLIPDFRNHNQDKTNTWEFATDENSTIVVDGKQYPYLYYSTLRANYKNNRLSRTVAYDDIEFFLNDKLDKMNFTAKEKADFLEYWLPEFKPWYVYGISFKFNEEFSPYAKLTFKHTPTKSFRMFMEAHQYPISKRINFDRSHPDKWDKLLLKSFDRGSDFDMLEWGGNLVKLKK